MRLSATFLCCLAVLWGGIASAYVPVGVGVDFDPPNGVTRIDPGQYTTFTAYITASYTDGLRRLALTASVTPGAAVLNSVDLSVFHPEAVTVSGGFGDTENGWIIEAPECVTSGPSGVVVVARLEFFALGPAGEITIAPHPSEGVSCYRCGQPEGPYPYMICSHGGILQDPYEPGGLCGFPHTRVTCEPQGGDNPTHPVTYWYDVASGYGGDPYGPCFSFHVQVFDPDIGNYTNWVEPPTWTHADTLTLVGDEYWVSWSTDDGVGLFCNGWHRFGFDNANESEWGMWTLSSGSSADPYASTLWASWSFGEACDGYGRLVHSPSAATAVPVESGSWGTIKALYR